MKTLVIVTHPNIEASNWNQAWVKAAREQGDITVHELHKAYPDENIDVAAEQRLIEAHGLTALFSNIRSTGTARRRCSRNGSMPCCCTAGLTVRKARKRRAKKSASAISTYGTEESYQANGSNGPLDEILRPIQALARFISAKYLPHFALNDTSNVTPERLAKSSADYVNYLKTVQPVSA